MQSTNYVKFESILPTIVKIHTHICLKYWHEAYLSSWKSSKEGDLPLCILPKREILRETIL